MLTALSVAREIGMVPPTESIILVQGYPQVQKADAYLEFHCTEGSNKKVSGVKSTSLEVVQNYWPCSKNLD